MNGGKWRQVNTWLCLDTSCLFFHIVGKLDRAFFVLYDDICQALAVEDTVLEATPGLHVWQCWQMEITDFGDVSQLLNVWKSEGVKLYLGWGTYSQCQLSSRAIVKWEVCSLAVLCISGTLKVSRPSRQCWIASLRHCNDHLIGSCSYHHTAWPESMRMILCMSQKIVAIAFSVLAVVLTL